MAKANKSRPNGYTPELGAAICKRLAEGETLTSICKPDDMPAESTVRSWALDNIEGFAATYARARDIGIDHKADYLLDMAADKTRDPNCRRVEIDALKWYLCKLAPKRYGDRLELAGDKDAPIQTRVVIEVIDSPQKGEN